MVGAPLNFRVPILVSEIQAPPLRAKLGCIETAADFVRQISQSRVYQDYERAFGKITKLPLELSTIDSCGEVHRVLSNYANPFCTILGRASEICAACLKVHRKLAGPDVSDTETVRCFAGLTYTSVPVKLDKRVIGFLQTGQVLLRNPSANRFRKIATQLTNWGMELNLPRLERAYFRSRVVSPLQYRAIVGLLEIFAEHLSLIANQISLRQYYGGSAIVRRAINYIADHKSEPIRLEQIARALNNVTTFYFCRRFKMETGLTFVEYLSRVRIEQAKILLHNNNLRVSEIAYEVGFQSLTHFNRTFRKLVRSSPTEYRSRVTGTR
jgi:AraC-like DNA-binding protein/ligand-binding sensor protein